MGLDTEKLMILLQRRYSAIRELDKLTRELEETINRNDGVSAAMVLQLREDEMEKADRCMEEIWQMGESDRKSYERICSLINVDPATAVGETKEEEKIFEIRRKTQTVIENLRRADQRLNFRVAGDKSYYRTGEL